MVNDAVKHVLHGSSESNLVREAAIAHGMKTMRHYGIQLIGEGLTTVEEVLGVTREE